MANLIAEKIAEAVRLRHVRQDAEAEAARKKAEAEQAEKERVEEIEQLWGGFSRQYIVNYLAKAAIELQKIGGNVTKSYHIDTESDKVIARFEFVVYPPLNFGEHEVCNYITLFKSGEVTFARQHDPYKEKVQIDIHSLDESAIEKIIADMMLSALKPR